MKKDVTQDLRTHQLHTTKSLEALHLPHHYTSKEVGLGYLDRDTALTSKQVFKLV